ncbi:MAG: D-glycero-alpha-D-manno-heptose-1,7-bisphosphate 7-phosphatase [Deltaproteobacteria bacterium]
MDGPKNKAIFLDRDGVLSLEKGYITSVDQLELYPFSEQAVLKLKAAGWKTIVVTNQACVARGLMTESDLQIIHNQLSEFLQVDNIYYCPHHPQGEADNPYAIRCNCRKPEAGLILKAARENHIDIDQSYMIGDRATDVIAGKKAGLTTVLVRTGYGSSPLEQPVEPDLIFNDLGEFVDFLVG